jgi:hypothetical protein
MSAGCVCMWLVMMLLSVAYVYSAAKFTLFHVNSQIFTLFHEILFLLVWTANKAKYSLSWAFLQKIFFSKQSMLPPLIGKIKDFLWKSPWEAILALFAAHTGKKKDFVKKCEILWIHVNSHEKVWIWQHCRSTTASSNEKVANPNKSFIKHVILGLVERLWKKYKNWN